MKFVHKLAAIVIPLYFGSIVGYMNLMFIFMVFGITYFVFCKAVEYENKRIIYVISREEEDKRQEEEKRVMDEVDSIFENNNDLFKEVLNRNRIVQIHDYPKPKED